MIKAVLGKFVKKGAAEAELRKSSWRWHHPRPSMTIQLAPQPPSGKEGREGAVEMDSVLLKDSAFREERDGVERCQCRSIESSRAGIQSALSLSLF